MDGFLLEKSVEWMEKCQTNDIWIYINSFVIYIVYGGKILGDIPILGKTMPKKFYTPPPLFI